MSTHIGTFNESGHLRGISAASLIQGRWFAPCSDPLLPVAVRCIAFKPVCGGQGV